MRSLAKLAVAVMGALTLGAQAGAAIGVPDLTSIISQAVTVAPESMPASALQYYYSKYRESASSPIVMQVSALESSFAGQTVFIVESVFPGAFEEEWMIFGADGSALARASKNEDGELTVRPTKDPREV